MGTTPNMDIKLLTDISLIIGFSDTRIDKVLKNIDYLFSVEGICKFVEIRDNIHGQKIFEIISKIFQDVEFEGLTEIFDNFEIEDDFFDDWTAIIEDDSLRSMATDNLMSKQMSQDKRCFQSDDSLAKSDAGECINISAPNSIH